jgi:hypothetical protein
MKKQNHELTLPREDYFQSSLRYLLPNETSLFQYKKLQWYL